MTHGEQRAEAVRLIRELRERVIVLERLFEIEPAALESLPYGFQPSVASARLRTRRDALGGAR